MQQQRRPEQRLPEAALLSATPSSGNQKQHTGAFARLPMVPVSTEIIESALKRAGRVAANKKLKNEAQKARSRYNPHHTSCLLFSSFAANSHEAVHTVADSTQEIAPCTPVTVTERLPTLVNQINCMQEDMCD